MAISGDDRAPEGLDLPYPYLLFIGDAKAPAYAKTAIGLRDWAPELCIGECAVCEDAISLGLPRLSPAEAVAKGARALVIGTAGPGGQIAENWLPTMIEALEAGLDIISGMHFRLEESPALKSAVERTGRRYIDVRRPPDKIPVATGRKRTGMRLLTVGTDCALGKKYTALALAKAMTTRGVSAEFRATGQTGVMIARGGIAMDSVVSDFSAGAAEMLTPDNAAGHWDVIEGQGSLFHPAFAAVSLGLLHGSQPDVIVVCHEAGRTDMMGWPQFKLPSLRETIELNLKMGARTNPSIRCAGVSLNTSALSPEDALQAAEALSREIGLPVADPLRAGGAFERLIDACLS